MKPVGKPDAGNPHVAQATAPVLDSTPLTAFGVKILIVLGFLAQ